MVSGDSMHLLFCVLSIKIGWHIDYRVTFANKYSELGRRQPDVREFFQILCLSVQTGEK